MYFQLTALFCAEKKKEKKGEILLKRGEKKKIKFSLYLDG
jgi:hypothetical protein